MRADVFYGPPGTGKTRKLLDLMAALVASGVKSDDIGFVSFTKAGADEALRRLDLTFSRTIRTIHSFAYSLAGVTQPQVIDWKKLKEFSQLVGYEIKGDNPDGSTDIGEGDIMMSVVQFAQARMSTLAEAHQAKKCDIDYRVVEMFAKSYEKWKRSYGFMDFDDMLRRVVDSGDVNLDVDYLIVDEAQDLTPLQWRFIELASKHIKQLILAGDDDQCIYAWGGAQPDGMRRYHDFGNVSILQQSWRVPRSVHKLALSVIHRVTDRVEKAYRPRNFKGEVVEHYDLQYAPRPDGECLILYRNHKSRREIESWLISNRVAYGSTGRLQTAMTDRYANAVRAFQALRAGKTLTGTQVALIEKHSDSKVAQWMKKREFDRVRGFEWWNVMHIPFDRTEYLRSVDLDAKPTVTLSTIHSAKGMEADKVILMNSMGERTWQNMSDDEHRVWYVAVTRARKELHIVHGDNPYDLEV